MQNKTILKSGAARSPSGRIAMVALVAVALSVHIPSAAAGGSETFPYAAGMAFVFTDVDVTGRYVVASTNDWVNIAPVILEISWSEEPNNHWRIQGCGFVDSNLNDWWGGGGALQPGHIIVHKVIVPTVLLDGGEFCSASVGEVYIQGW